VLIGQKTYNAKRAKYYKFKMTLENLLVRLLETTIHSHLITLKSSCHFVAQLLKRLKSDCGAASVPAGPFERSRWQNTHVNECENRPYRNYECELRRSD
jgi:hypothetical protein